MNTKWIMDNREANAVAPGTPPVAGPDTPLAPAMITRQAGPCWLAQLYRRTRYV